MQLNRMLGLAVLVVLATGCAKKELILEGQRFDVRTPLSEAIPDANADEADQTAALDEQINRSIKINLPRPTNLNAWTHRNGGVDHYSGNLALGADLTRLWSSGIGSGNSRKYRITSDPVVAGGRIYTLDSQSRVMAHSPIGAAIWVRELTPPSDRTDDATGGGLAYEDGVVFATTGFGEVSALDASDGRVLWTQKLDAAIVAPPTVSKGIVFVVSRDNRAWALKAGNGRIDWQQQSTRAAAGLIGGAAPAVSGRMVVLPFSSGELVAAMANNGLRAWSVAVSGSRRGQARSNIGDISGDPVITRNRVYAANQSGRVTAINLRDGERIWTANEGAYSPVWPVDNSVFLVSDAAQLVRLDARNGEVIWAIDLPAYRKEKTRRDSYAHFGPVLAGGRLLVASSDGMMRFFDPVSGDLLSSVEIPSGAASQPAIVDGVLYILSQNGQLHAYR